MVDLTNDPSIDVDVPAPSVSVQVFGDGSIGEAFGGFMESIIGGLMNFFKKIIASETSMRALTNLTAVLIVAMALLMAYRTVGRGA